MNPTARKHLLTDLTDLTHFGCIHPAAIQVEESFSSGFEATNDRNRNLP
jgi:hypothetical protein